MKRRTRKIRVRERKLQRDIGGRGKLYGLAWSEQMLIEVDPRQRPRCYLDTIIHEALHLLRPDESETRVTNTAHKLADVLWRCGYRRVSQ